MRKPALFCLTALLLVALWASVYHQAAEGEVLAVQPGGQVPTIKEPKDKEKKKKKEKETDKEKKEKKKDKEKKKEKETDKEKEGRGSTVRAGDVDVIEYMDGLQFKPEEVLAVRPGPQASTIKEEKETADRRGTKLIVTTLKPVNLETNFDDIAILDPSSKVIYPGALVKVNQDLVRGNPQALTALYRNRDRQLILNIDLPDLPPMKREDKVVDKPQYDSVQEVIDKMTSAWLEKHSSAKDQEQERTTILAQMQWKESVMNNSHQLMSDLGLAVDASKGSVSTKLKLDVSSKKKVAIIHFKQVFYTVNVNQPRDAADYLGKTASKELLRKYVTAKEPPGYVHSVSYGRLLMVRIESSSDTTKGELDTLCKYAMGTASIEANAQIRYENILEKSDVSTIVIGGGATQGAKLKTTLAKLPAKITEFTTQHADFTKNNRGLPIAYTVYFLGGFNGTSSNAHKLAKMSLRTDYTKEENKEYDEGLIVVENPVGTGYSGFVKLTYEEFRQEAGRWGWHNQEKKKEHLTVGTKFSQVIPPRSRNIRLQVWHRTWIAWDEWRATDGLESKTWDTPPRIKFTVKGWSGKTWADPKEGELP
jgi:hypothetical protein